MERVICFHLFNDYSGSPKVMKMVLEGLLKKGYRIDLVSSKGGIFDELHYQNLHRHSYPYRFSNNPAVTMLRYCGVQFYTFLLAFRWLFCKGVVFYINTLLPIGPALAGKLMGKRITITRTLLPRVHFISSWQKPCRSWQTKSFVCQLIRLLSYNEKNV